MLKLTQTLLASVAVAGLVVPAVAAPAVCGKRDAFVKALADHYKERRESLGISTGGLLTEVFVSGSGSWTIMVTTKEGLSCIVSAGERWNGLTPAAIKESAL